MNTIAEEIFRLDNLENINPDKFPTLINASLKMFKFTYSLSSKNVVG